jgi:hypothetical protein
MATFFETVSAAVADLAEHGYDSEERLQYWVETIRQSALEQMVSEAVLDEQLRRVLAGTYERLINRGLILRHHPGVSRFTLELVKPKLRAELDRRILASANLIKLNRQQTIADTLRRFQGWATSIPVGGAKVDKVETKNDVRKELAGQSFRERRVLIDQGHKLVSAINSILATDGGAIAALWRSHFRQVHYDFRPDHRDRDARYKGADWVYAIRGNWALQQRLMKAGRAGYTDQITQPGEEVYCLPGTTQIPFADGVEVAYRRWYSGQLTKVITATGKTLRATPNHPVLTPDGWVAIGALQEGDDLIEVAGEIIRVSPSESHQDHTVTNIAQIFGALFELGVTEVRGGQRKQFHGDGSESDIDVVWTDRPLRFGGNADGMQRGEHVVFTEPVQAGLAAGAADQFDFGRLTAATGGMGGGDQLGAALGTCAGHPQYAGLTAVAERDASLFQAVSEISARRSQPTGQRENALSRFVRVTRIIKVDQRRWTGHVFNLQTSSGWYIANGIVTHNCRCYYTYLYHLRELPESMLTAAGNDALTLVRAKA